MQILVATLRSAPTAAATAYATLLPSLVHNDHKPLEAVFKKPLHSVTPRLFKNDG